MRACRPLDAVSTSKPIRAHRSATALKTQGSSSAMSIFGATLFGLDPAVTRTSNVSVRPSVSKRRIAPSTQAQAKCALVRAPWPGISITIKPTWHEGRDKDRLRKTTQSWSGGQASIRRLPEQSPAAGVEPGPAGASLLVRRAGLDDIGEDHRRFDQPRAGPV